MTKVAFITKINFWERPAGNGTSVSNRLKVISEIFDEVKVIFVTHRHDRILSNIKGKTFISSHKLKPIYVELEKQLVQQIDDYIEQEKFDALHFDYNFASNVGKKFSGSKICDVHDLVSKRGSILTKNGYTKHSYTLDTKTEIESLKNYDTIVLMNNIEADYCAREKQLNAVSILPSFDSVGEIHKASTYLGCLGSKAIPNIDGLNYYKSVLPNDMKLGGELSLQEDFSEYFTSIGIVNHVKDFYANLYGTISPTRFGTGIKQKVLESFAYGVPVFGTSHSFEGLPDGWQECSIVADDINKWNEFSRLTAISKQKCLNYINEYFSTKVIADQFKGVYGL